MPKLSIARLRKWCTAGKVSVTPKSRLSRNNRKTYYNNFAASAVLVYGQPSQEPPIDGEFLSTSWNIDWKVFFLDSESCQLNAKSGVIDQMTLNDPLVGHPCCTEYY